MSNSTPRSTTVLYGTLAISAISAFGTGLYSIITRKSNYGTLSAGAAVNGGITAATFFGIREYAVSPIISKALDANKSESLPPTLSELRTEKLLDSGISGFVTGGMIRSLISGLRVALPAALTVGTACTGLQLLLNQLKISRLRHLSASLARPDEVEAAPSRLVPSPSHIAPTHTSNDMSKSETNWTTSLLKFIGVKPLSDEEYLSKLRSQREAYMKRIAELESQMDTKTEKKGID